MSLDDVRQDERLGYAKLYAQAQANMAAHFEEARRGAVPCACVGATGKGEMCPDGAAIYATCVNPWLLADEVRP